MNRGIDGWAYVPIVPRGSSIWDPPVVLPALICGPFAIVARLGWIGGRQGEIKGFEVHLRATGHAVPQTAYKSVGAAVKACLAALPLAPWGGIKPGPAGEGPVFPCDQAVFERAAGEAFGWKKPRYNMFGMPL